MFCYICFVCGLFVASIAYRSVVSAPDKAAKARFSILDFNTHATSSSSDDGKQHSQCGFRSTVAGQFLAMFWVVNPFLLWAYMFMCCGAHYGYGDPLGLESTVDAHKFESLTQPFLFACFGQAIFFMLGVSYTVEFSMFFLQCCPLSEADHVLVEWEGKMQLCDVEVETTKRSFHFMVFRYTYVEDVGRFRPIGIQAVTGASAGQARASNGLGANEVREKQNTFGRNEIVVHVPGIFRSLLEEYHTKIYYYQFTVTWFALYFDYWNVGLLWLFLIIGSGIYVSVVVKRANKLKIQEMASMSDSVRVLRDGSFQQISSTALVPGDLLVIKPGTTLACDCILAQGAAVVAEGMLTGEPMPITKVPIDASASASTSVNTLFSGTDVLDVGGDGDNGTIAIVCAIGGATQKADLVRAVLFPSEVRFQYVEDLRTVYMMMFAYACGLMVAIRYCNYPFNRPDSEQHATSIFIRGAFCICQAINPMLGVAIASGQATAAVRLGDKGIRCLEPQRIPIAGCINMMVLDKTGTITKDCMELYGVQESRNDGMGRLRSANKLNELDELSRFILASCHKLSEVRGELVGNHVELSMFGACPEWRLTNVGGTRTVTDGKQVIEVLRILEFDHSRMTSGVVCKLPSGEVHVFIKGASSAVAKLCGQFSPDESAGLATACCVATEAGENEPQSFLQASDAASAKGLYVLGVGSKLMGAGDLALTVSEASRDELEAGLQLHCLLLFSNELKPDSSVALAELSAGGVGCLMCTGDHLLSGVHVAKKVGLIPPKNKVLQLKVERNSAVWYELGKVGDPAAKSKMATSTTSPTSYVVDQIEWDRLLKLPAELSAVLPKISVFGRFRPDGKVSVVEQFQRLGYYVGVCGDGGNDCGALRAAHAGLALSEAEASIVAPFSSGQDKSLLRLGELLREGRACVSTNLACFYFFMAYGFAVTTAKTSVLLLNGGTMSIWQWFFVDIFLVLAIPCAMTYCASLPTLSASPPSCSLLSCRAFTTVVGTQAIFCMFYYCAMQRLWEQPFYLPWDPEMLGVSAHNWTALGDSFDVETAFFMLTMHLAMCGLIYSYGGRQRAGFLLNWRLLIAYVATVASLLAVVFSNGTSVNCLLHANCDSETLLHLDIPALRGISVTPLNGCFLGPQLGKWLEQMPASLPKNASAVLIGDVLAAQPLTCLPDSADVEKFRIGKQWLDLTKINNNISPHFAGLLACIFLVHFVVMHVFQEYVVLSDSFDELDMASEADARARSS
jgi:cation-transporting ATPase 13A3/4/5